MLVKPIDQERCERLVACLTGPRGLPLFELRNTDSSYRGDTTASVTCCYCCCRRRCRAVCRTQLCGAGSRCWAQRLQQLPGDHAGRQLRREERR